MHAQISDVATDFVSFRRFKLHLFLQFGREFDQVPVVCFVVAFEFASHSGKVFLLISEFDEDIDRATRFRPEGQVKMRVGEVIPPIRRLQHLTCGAMLHPLVILF